MARTIPSVLRSPVSPDVVLLNRRRMWSRLSRSQSVSFIWTSAARMSPPSVGLVLQGTEAPMWDTFSSVLTHSSAHSGGPIHGVCVYVARNARVSRRTRIHLDAKYICVLRRSLSPWQNSLLNYRDSRYYYLGLWDYEKVTHHSNLLAWNKTVTTCNTFSFGFFEGDIRSITR